MTVVCIAGMHRSGTSMITRILNLCGLYLGEQSDLLPAASDNPEGFWENAKFVQINDEILATLGGSWYLPPEIRPGWENSPELSILREQAQELIQQFNQHNFWGWKDPRNSLTLPFWQLLIPDLKVIIPLRNPLEVAQSLVRRNQFSEIFSLDLWQTYYQRLMSSSDAENRLITHYITPFFTPELELHRILDFLGIKVEDSVIQNACRTTLSSLRHNRATFRSLVKGGVPLDSVNLYTEMCLQSGEFFWGIIRSDIKSSSNDELDLITEQDLISKLKNKDPLLQLMIQWEADKQRHIESLIVGGQAFRAESDRQLAERDQQLAERDQQLAERDQQLAERDQQLAERDQQLAERDQQLAEIIKSKVWKFAVLLRKIRVRLIPPGSFLEKTVRMGYRAIQVWRNEGFLSLALIIKNRSKGNFVNTYTPNFEYQNWILENELATELLAEQSENSLLFSKRPLISILTPVYNTPENVLRATIQSVIDQTYTNWELCLVDGNSNDQTKAVLEYFQKVDARIKCEFLAKNLGISGNTNVALQCATGEYVNLLDHDDLLPPFALFEIAKYIVQHPDVDLIYGDEDHVDLNGHRHHPFFKPDWCPVLLQSFMYIGHSTYKKELVLSLGGFRPTYDFSQDYDLALRVTESAKHIGHIPKVLYHWRELPGSAAAGGKDYARESNIAALANALERRGYTAEAVALPTHNQVVYRFIEKPLISIIVPSDSPQNITKSLKSIREKTNYHNYEVLVITNSNLVKTLQGKYKKEHIRFLSFDQEYNFSAKCNYGVSQAKGEYVIFLNDDVYPVTNDWIEKMLGVFQQKDVGAVSPKMVYTNGTIQHAGLVTGVRNLVGTAFHTFPKDSTFHFNMAQCPRTVSALSAACLLMRRDVFFEIGGYDEVNTPIMHSDLDLCFKIRDMGLRLVYMPEAELTHVGHLSIKEIESKNVVHSPKSDAYILKRWAKYVAYDPYFPNNMRDMLYIDSPTKIRMWATNPPESISRYPDILIQTHDLSLSGVPIIAHDQAVDLVDRGFFVTIVAAKSGEQLDTYKSEKIPVIIDSLVLDSPQAMESFLVNFDVVMANTVMAWRLVLTAKSLNIPVLWVIQEGDFGIQMVRENKTIQNALSLADRVIFSSHQTLIKYSEFGDGHNYSSMFFGVEAPAGILRFSQKEPGKKLQIIHIGSVESRKGQDTLIDAIKALPQHLKDKIEVSFIGRILDVKYYQHQFKKSATMPNVHWLGSLSQIQVWERLSQSDVLVCSSRDETGPLVVYEAMCLGKAVLSTPVGAVPEIIQNGVNGMVFLNSDQLNNLLEELCLDKTLVEKLGKEAFATYNEMLTKHDSNEKIHDLIKSIIK